MAPLLLISGLIVCKLVVSVTHCPFVLWGSGSWHPYRREDIWASDRICTFWRREESVASAGIWTTVPRLSRQYSQQIKKI